MNVPTNVGTIRMVLLKGFKLCEVIRCSVSQSKGQCQHRKRLIMASLGQGFRLWAGAVPGYHLWSDPQGQSMRSYQWRSLHRFLQPDANNSATWRLLMKETRSFQKIASPNPLVCLHIKALNGIPLKMSKGANKTNVQDCSPWMPLTLFGFLCR